MTPDWAPFQVASRERHAPAPRRIDSLEGIADRLRSAAFAELQAMHAFRWAASSFADASEELRGAWLRLGDAEERHLHWLLARMRELDVAVDERPVSDHLWVSLVSCQSAREFALYMANAEERGRRAGDRFCDQMKVIDPATAEIFGRIAFEEIEHIQLASRYFPQNGLEA